MVKCENKLKELKFRVLKAVAETFYNDKDPAELLMTLPKEIIPGPKATLRCCIFKERAIIQERLNLGLGGHNTSKNILEALPIACDECPEGGYEVTTHCRGCIARNCMKACKRDAIVIEPNTRRAYIDKSKCVRCGMCSKACQYNSIIFYERPCEAACAMKCISKGEQGEAVIDNDRCIGCGQCIARCPFGAIIDKSYIREVIKLIKNKEIHTYAIIAPAYAASFRGTNIKQMATAIRKLGFYDMIETSYGADLVAAQETDELLKKGKITSSCCPSLVSYIKKELPEFAPYISECLSPMATLAEYIKKKDSLAKIVFIGPCTSKKYERLTKHVGGRVDVVLTFEELQAMLAAKNIEPSLQGEGELNESSSFGRGFAQSGGVTDAIKNRLKELGSDFELKPMVISGVKNFKVSLKKFVESDEYNYFEGMTCEGGCINGPCALYHDILNSSHLKTYIEGKK